MPNFGRNKIPKDIRRTYFNVNGTIGDYKALKHGFVPTRKLLGIIFIALFFAVLITGSLNYTSSLTEIEMTKANFNIYDSYAEEDATYEVTYPRVDLLDKYSDEEILTMMDSDGLYRIESNNNGSADPGTQCGLNDAIYKSSLYDIDPDSQYHPSKYTERNGGTFTYNADGTVECSDTDNQDFEIALGSNYATVRGRITWSCTSQTYIYLLNSGWTSTMTFHIFDTYIGFKKGASAMTNWPISFTYGDIRTFEFQYDAANDLLWWQFDNLQSREYSASYDDGWATVKYLRMTFPVSHDAVIYDMDIYTSNPQLTTSTLSQANIDADLTTDGYTSSNVDYSGLEIEVHSPIRHYASGASPYTYVEASKVFPVRNNVEHSIPVHDYVTKSWETNEYKFDYSPDVYLDRDNDYYEAFGLTNLGLDSPYYGYHHIPHKFYDFGSSWTLDLKYNMSFMIDLNGYGNRFCMDIQHSETIDRYDASPDSFENENYSTQIWQLPHNRGYFRPHFEIEGSLWYSCVDLDEYLDFTGNTATVDYDEDLDIFVLTTDDPFLTIETTYLAEPTSVEEITDELVTSYSVYPSVEISGTRKFLTVVVFDSGNIEELIITIPIGYQWDESVYGLEVVSGTLDTTSGIAITHMSGPIDFRNSDSTSDVVIFQLSTELTISEAIMVMLFKTLIIATNPLYWILVFVAWYIVKRVMDVFQGKRNA